MFIVTLSYFACSFWTKQQNRLVTRDPATLRSDSLRRQSLEMQNLKTVIKF